MKLMSAALLSALAACALNGAAQADTDVLWDQSAISLAAPMSFPNAVATGFNGYTSFGMSDVTVGGGGWNLNTVTTYYSALSWFEGTVTQAVLNVFPKTGALPTAANDPRVTFGSGVLVNVSRTQFDVAGNGVAAYTVTGLNMNLAPGDYWVGLTPTGPGGFFGPDLQWATSNYYGATQATRMYPDSGWMNSDALGVAFGAGHVGNLDGAMFMSGSIIPAPSGLAMIGLGGLCVARRRRR